jgi:hypothetical protein
VMDRRSGVAYISNVAVANRDGEGADGTGSRLVVGLGVRWGPWGDS